MNKDLWEIISDPPVLLLDVRQALVFYRGVQVILPLMSFRLLELLAGNPKAVITRAQIYERLWLESEGNGDASRPYEQQITDHKRKLLDGIRKVIKGFPGIDPAGLKNMIVTRPRIGYMLNLDREDVAVLQDKVPLFLSVNVQSNFYVIFFWNRNIPFRCCNDNGFP